jgi:flagellar biosynthesis/type III secretory pathway chaperone
MDTQRNEIRSDLKSGLENFTALLDRERDCLECMRYQDLLQIVSEKQILLAKIADATGKYKKDSHHKESMERARFRELTEAVREKSIHNERLARSSIRIVQDLASFIDKQAVLGGQYDNKGVPRGSLDVSTLRGSV